MTNTGRRGAVAARGVVFCCLLWAGIPGCRPKPPVLKLKDIRLASLGPEGMFLVDFDVYNPNLYDAKIKEFRYSFRIDGREVAVATAGKGPITCKATEWTPVATVLTLDVFGVLEAGMKAIGADRIAYEMRGRAVFDCMGLDLPVPLAKSGHIARVQRLSWRFDSVILPRGAGVMKIVFRVGNPNDFDVPIASLTGTLEADGKTVLRLERPSVEKIPRRSEATVAIAVRVDALGLARVLAAMASRKETIRLKPRFKLDPPISLRKILLRGVEKK